MNPKVKRIIYTIDELYPDAHCELNHHNAFELLIAVVLSAQTTDKRVNMVTPDLFRQYPNSKLLGNANFEDVAVLIRSIGLYRNKTLNIIALSKELEDRFMGIVPNNRRDLMSLSGVGRKTANVVLAVAYDVPTFAVDTHVARIAKRLGLAKYSDDVETIERKLCRKIDRQLWNKSHHQFIFFGRYFCKAIKPECEQCPLSDICKKTRYE